MLQGMAGTVPWEPGGDIYKLALGPPRTMRFLQKKSAMMKESFIE